MSKSVGNVIDPLDVIDRVGADPLRFGLAWQATDAQNIPFGEEHIDAGRRFANKIWNASRLVLGTRGDRTGPPAAPDVAVLTLPERWLLARHEAMLEEVDAALDAYRYADAAQALHRFFWSELCDWGLEVEKERLYEASDAERETASELLAWVLERTLRALHPIMPFVTEEVWLRFDAGASIVVAPWPEQRSEHRDPEAEGRFASARSIVTAIRRFRKAHGIRDAEGLVATVVAEPERRDDVLAMAPEIRRLANLAELTVAAEVTETAGALRLAADGAEVVVARPGSFDVGAERARLAKRLAETDAEASTRSAKLANEGFLAKAPEAIVAKERERLAALDDESAALRDQLERLG
jgi:valyl-tRNA synthetase